MHIRNLFTYTFKKMPPIRISSVKKSKKKSNKKTNNYNLFPLTTKSRIFSTISFAVILLFIYADNIIANFSIFTADVKMNELLKSLPNFKTTSFTNTNPTVQHKAEKEEEVESSDPMIPPRKANRGERISWFRRKLPEIEILNSTQLSQRFHSRVLELFNNKCSAQFFMIWLSTTESFGPREFLAADTLFNTNPKGCLLILSRSMDSGQGYKILKPLLDRGFNILAITPDIPFLVKNTPAEVWLDELKSGNMDPGSVPLFNHLSDLIRLAVLYKYGGVYLDTDFIFLKDLSGLRNAVGAQSINMKTKKWNRLNGAVMIFDIYHPLLVEFLNEFATTFNGNRWGHNGPYLVSRVIERLGSKPEYNLTIFPPQGFYPMDWVKIGKLFKKPESSEGEMNRVEDTVVDISRGSYAVHLWNKISKGLNIEQGSVMEKLISSHCVICEHTYDS